MTNRDELGNSVLRSAARLTRWASRNASFDVPMAQARLLALVEELGPSRVSALAAADHCSQPTMSAQLHRLEAEGWAERVVDQSDARASLISLTTAGRAALGRARQARLEALSPAFDQLDTAALERLQVAVDALDDLLARASGDSAANPAVASTRHTRQGPANLTRTERSLTPTMWRQPKTVWSVAFACVIAFMGIGLVDPILKPIADDLGASASQVSLLFTSYMAVMGVAMLVTGWVSSRAGAKRTLLLGLVDHHHRGWPCRRPGLDRRDRRLPSRLGAG